MCKNQVARSKVTVTAHTHSLFIASHVQPIISSCMVGFENYLAQMIIKTRHCVLYKNHVATSKVKFTVRIYSFCIGLNETYLFLARNFVVGPASGMVQFKDLVFHPVVRSSQGTILLEALGRASVSKGHIFFLVKNKLAQMIIMIR